MKKFKSKRKILKGMTLVEIIIAIAIIAVMSLVLVSASSIIQAYLRSSDDVNNRVAVQAPIAQAGNVNAAKIGADDIKIYLAPENVDGTIALGADIYAVYSSDEMDDHAHEAGGGLNMKFIANIETTTEAPTQAITTPGNN